MKYGLAIWLVLVQSPERNLLSASVLAPISELREQWLRQLAGAVMVIDEKEVENSLRRLKSIGEIREAERLLLKLLCHPDSTIRRNAIVGLGRLAESISREGVQELGRLAKEEELFVRQEAFSALAHLGLNAIKAAPVVRICLKDPDPRIRADAAHALWYIAQDAVSCVSTYAELLSVPDAAIRLRAALGLSSLHTHAGVATEAMVRALNDDDWRVGALCARTLYQLGEPGIAHLIRESESRNVVVRRAVLRALQELETPSVIDLVVIGRLSGDVGPIMQSLSRPRLRLEKDVRLKKW